MAILANYGFMHFGNSIIEKEEGYYFESMPVNDVKRCEWCGNNAEEFVVFHGEKMCVDCRDAELKEAESLAL